MRTNGGVITRPEALALGIASSTLHSWIADGRLEIAGHGVYVLPGVLDQEHTLLRAAVRTLAGVVSHGSAARLHGVDCLDPGRTTITVPVRQGNRFKGVIVHQSTDLTADQTNDVMGMPVTDPPRTVIDLAAVLPVPLLEVSLDQMVRMRLTTYERVADRLEAIARKGKPGVVKLRGALKPRLGGTFVSDSALETCLLRVIRDGALPRPDTQYRPEWLRSINGRVDLAYVEEQVIVEGDSQRWHGSPEAFQSDRTWDNLAQLAGWIILRFTWEDLTTRPQYVVSTISRALSQRGSSDTSEPVH